MRRSRKWWWVVYGVCVAAVLAALGVISGVLLDLESAEHRARVDATRQEAARDALWRMDSWLAPLLAQEAARPYFEYLAFYPESRAYDRFMSNFGPNEVLTRSPLVTFTSELFRLHFQVGPDGRLTSPQVPEGGQRDLAQATCMVASTIDANGTLLERVDEVVVPDDVRAELARLEPAIIQALFERPDPVQTVETQQELNIDQTAQNRKVAKQRAQAVYGAKGGGAGQNAGTGEWIAQNVVKGGVEQGVTVGALIPMWLGSGEERELCFIRRVKVGQDEILQGFLADWPKLRVSLLDQAKDLFSDASLDPVSADEAVENESGRVLATVPAALAIPALELAGATGFTPARGALLATWLAVLAAVVAVAMTLRASIEYGERRSRFASTVTHELRTPLTTFRMYSEMLADGMVKDPEKRALYLQTMQAEAGRLSVLVENVLAYARLEDGRARARREDTTFGACLERVMAPLERRAAAAGVTLTSERDGEADAALRVDVEAVGQILFNLVDNACKYGASGDGATVSLSAALSGGRLRIVVADSGPGVPEKVRRAIFEPFDRGARDEADEVSGVGLGLALSRGLARELGGDLTLGSGPGARFVLDLPATS